MVTPGVLSRLRDALGADHVLTSGIEKYAHGKTEDFEFRPKSSSDGKRGGCRPCSRSRRRLGFR
jgi:hypothetical protein